MSSNCLPTIIDHSPAKRLRDVSSELMTSLMKNSSPENVSTDGTQGDQRSSKLKNGDLVYIITFVDVHHVYVRNVEDDNTAFKNFTKSIHFHCLAAKPISYMPNLNEIVGAKYNTDGLYYRARILKKISFFRYSVHFIDYGYKETVYSSNIVSLPTKFTEIPIKISLVKLKGIQLCKLNKDACAFVDVISNRETITIDYIQEDTNYVILKTSKNQNINVHLKSLIFGNNNNIKTIVNDKAEEKTEITGSASVFKIRKIPASPDNDDVYGSSELGPVLMKEEQMALEHDVRGSGESASVSMTKVLAVSEHDFVHRLVERLSVVTRTGSPVPPVTSSVGTMLELLAPPATSSIGTMVESPAPTATISVGSVTESPAQPSTCSIGTITDSPAPPSTRSVGTITEFPAPSVTSSVGTMTESLIKPGTSRWKRFKKSICRFVRRCSFR